MPENEFEKKISSEMQELRFRPSENVWLRVEERIKKKKERRIFVVIFLLAGLALLGYWQLGNLFGEHKNDITKTVQKDSSEEKQKEDNSQSANEVNNSSEIKQNTETTKTEETKNTAGKTADDKLTDDRSIGDKKDITVSKTYYRLNQVDFDGKTTYSNVISLSLENLANAGKWKLYPNPVKDRLNFITSNTLSNVQVRITDKSGKIVLAQKITTVQAGQLNTINVAALARGSYYMQLISDNNKQTTQFIKF